MLITIAGGGLRPVCDSLPRMTWRTGAGVSERHPPRVRWGLNYPLAGVQGAPVEPTAPADARTLAGLAVP